MFVGTRLSLLRMCSCLFVRCLLFSSLSDLSCGCLFRKSLKRGLIWLTGYFALDRSGLDNKGGKLGSSVELRSCSSIVSAVVPRNLTIISPGTQRRGTASVNAGANTTENESRARLEITVLFINHNYSTRAVGLARNLCKSPHEQGM